MSVSYSKGVGLASLSAGPLFVLASFACSPGKAVAHPGDWPLALVAALLSIPVGCALGFVPNLLGTALLGTVGQCNDGMRLPVFWVLAGAGAGACMDAGIAEVGAAAFAPLFTPVGAASALLCRAGTRWAD